MRKLYKPLESTFVHKNPAYVKRNDDVADAQKNIVTDRPLMQQIVNDLENGVTNRPSTPACFEDENELGVVDRDCDIRNSRWDELSAVYNPDVIRSKAEAAKAKQQKQDPSVDPKPNE